MKFSFNNFFQPHRLSVTQRLLAFPYLALNSIADPTRGEMVAGLGDLTGYYSLRSMQRDMKKSPYGVELLKRKTVISSDSLNFSELRGLPDGTLGKTYSIFMESHNFKADERPPVRFVDDEELAYIMLRYRQLHDFWHVICGVPPTVLGEIALKWFEWRKVFVRTQHLTCVIADNIVDWLTNMWAKCNYWSASTYTR